ncbi:MAG: M48 family metallopeptidase [Verrucomicrobiae bacterium]|nr:M48 family metallopeptidase [Verrucomicrobiae bacterium]
MKILHSYSFLFIFIFTTTLLKAVDLSTPKTGFVIVPVETEAKMGKEAFDEVKSKSKISKDKNKIALAKQVVNRLLPHIKTPFKDWEVVVFEDEEPNAFALPGGKIGVNTGIFPITQTEAGLATVLSHEIAHVTLRHGAKRMTQEVGVGIVGKGLDVLTKNQSGLTRKGVMTGYGLGATYGAVLPFSRNHEMEADRIGLITMAKAGYPMKEALFFWQRMAEATKGKSPPEFLSTHPADERRIKTIEELIPEIRKAKKSGQLE